MEVAQVTEDERIDGDSRHGVKSSTCRSKVLRSNETLPEPVFAPSVSATALKV